MKSKSVFVDGVEFIIHSMSVLECSELERKLTGIILPVFGSLFSNLNDLSNIMDKNLEFDKIGIGFQTGLGNLSESEFQAIIIKSLSKVQTKNGVFLHCIENINDNIFKTSTIYKLIFEVVKHNNMIFFELAGGGLISGINTTIEQKTKVKS